MRENQSLIDIIGWLLVALIALSVTMIIWGCGTVQHIRPSADDLAGAPITFYGDPRFYTDTERFTPKPAECDHFWVNQSVPQKDSTIILSIEQTETIAADKICICIYCKELNICF